MLIEINVFMRNNTEAAWKIWKNRYWFDLDFLPEMAEGVNIFKPLFDWHILTLKQNCEVVALEWHKADGAGGDPDGTSGHVSALFGIDARGIQPLGGEMKFKDVLRWRLEAKSGPTGRSFWHGSVDESQIIRPNDGRAGLHNVEHLQEIRREAWFQMSSGPLYRQFRVGAASGVFQSASGKRVVALSGPFYTQSHALTRWLSRLRGKGWQIFNSMLACLRQMEAIRHLCKIRIVQDGAFTYSQPFYQITAAIFQVKPVFEGLKDYMEDANEKEEDGKNPPEVRYGATGAYIRQVWEKQSDYVEEYLPELMKVAAPFEGSGGDEFIFTEHLQEYVDFAESVIKRLAYTLTFDWHNFKAYPNQQRVQDYILLPDAVELNL
jgi:hypothetical protein